MRDVGGESVETVEKNVTGMTLSEFLNQTTEAGARFRANSVIAVAFCITSIQPRQMLLNCRSRFYPRFETSESSS